MLQRNETEQQQFTLMLFEIVLPSVQNDLFCGYPKFFVTLSVLKFITVCRCIISQHLQTKFQTQITSFQLKIPETSIDVEVVQQFPQQSICNEVTLHWIQKRRNRKTRKTAPRFENMTYPNTPKLPFWNTVLKSVAK